MSRSHTELHTGNTEMSLVHSPLLRNSLPENPTRRNLQKKLDPTGPDPRVDRPVDISGVAKMRENPMCIVA